MIANHPVHSFKVEVAEDEVAVVVMTSSDRPRGNCRPDLAGVIVPGQIGFHESQRSRGSNKLGWITFVAQTTVHGITVIVRRVAVAEHGGSGRRRHRPIRGKGELVGGAKIDGFDLEVRVKLAGGEITGPYVKPIQEIRKA